MLQNAPDCFLLLSLIAIRARRTDENNWDGLEIGEAKLGDFKSCGLTRARYRAAIQNLKSNQQITIRTTNRGTIAKISNSAHYDINQKTNNHLDNQQITNKKPSGHQQITTNKKVKKEEEGNNEKNEIEIEGKFKNIILTNYSQSIEIFKMQCIRVGANFETELKKWDLWHCEKETNFASNRSAYFNFKRWLNDYRPKKEKTSGKKEKENEAAAKERERMDRELEAARLEQQKSKS